MSGRCDGGPSGGARGNRRPARPSGGNTYDRKVRGGLAALGWVVHEHRGVRRAARPGVSCGSPDGAVVLLDGLIASPAPEALVPHARRLRQVVLMHMPLGDESARARTVLAAATAASRRAMDRRRVEERTPCRPTGARGGARRRRLRTSPRGARPATRCLCVAPVTRDKGHDVLLDALAPRRTCRGAARSSAAWIATRRSWRGAPRAARRATGCVSPGRCTGPELDRARRRGPAGAALARRDVRHGRHRGAGTRGPGRRRDVGGVTEALGRARRRRRPARPARRPGCARRRAAGLARRRRAARAPAPGRSERRATLRGWAATRP